MILSDVGIEEAVNRGDIIIHGFDKKRLNPNSYDVTLGKKLLVYDKNWDLDDVLDCAKEDPTREIIIPSEGYILEPGELYLGTTQEYTETHNLVPMINGKSSWGRKGITIHITAGQGDNGFQGNWTLEITVVKRIRVYPGMPIAQLVWFTTGECLIKYNEKATSKYNKQQTTTASKGHLNFPQ